MLDEPIACMYPTNALPKEYNLFLLTPHNLSTTVYETVTGSQQTPLDTSQPPAALRKLGAETREACQIPCRSGKLGAT